MLWHCVFVSQGTEKNLEFSFNSEFRITSVGTDLNAVLKSLYRDCISDSRREDSIHHTDCDQENAPGCTR